MSRKGKAIYEAWIAFVILCALIFGASHACQKHFADRHRPATNVVREFDANADQKLTEMVLEKDGDIDLAQANWLLAKDIPEFHDLKQEAYFEQLDVMNKQVLDAMAAMQASGYGGMDKNDPQTRCRRFCSAIIGLQFTYVCWKQ